MDAKVTNMLILSSGSSVDESGSFIRIIGSIRLKIRIIRII